MLKVYRPKKVDKEMIHLHVSLLINDPLSRFPARLTPVRQAKKKFSHEPLKYNEFRSPALRDKFHGDPESVTYHNHWITNELQLNYN